MVRFSCGRTRVWESFFPLLWTDGRGSRGFGNSPADEADLCGLGCVWTFRVAFGLGWIWGFWLGEARDR